MVKTFDYQSNKVLGMDFMDSRKREMPYFVKYCLSTLCDFYGCSVWNPILLPITDLFFPFSYNNTKIE